MTVTLAKKLQASEVALMCGGRLIGDDITVGAVTTDSRDAAPGTMFIAIKGERFDGHDFVAPAAGQGLSAAMVSRIPDGIPGGLTLISVGDTVEALGSLAREYKRLFSLTVIAVTGSVGKTTTKEFVYSVVSEKYKTVKTEGNHNNNIGLPMTLLSLEADTEVAVIEMGMNAPREIAYLTRLAEPDIGIITNIGTSHIERLGSREGIAKAKLEIREGMKLGSKLLLNGDEPLLAGHDAIYIGKGEDCDFRIANVIEGNNGSAFDLKVDKDKIESIVIPTFGEHNVMNAAFAYAAGSALGIGEFEIRRGLMNYKTTGMRQKLGAAGGRTLIEDCYNASPESMIASLKVLSDMAKREHKRSVAVLGNMLELGFYSEEGHRRVGAGVALEMTGMLITFGKSAVDIAKSAVAFGMDPEKVFIFENTEDVRSVSDFLLKNTDDNDIILFKASRGVKLERVIDCIKNENK